MRSRAAWPPARGRCWWWMRRRACEAQSVANCYTALEQGLEVVPVLNKIDLPSADPDKVIKEIEEIIGIDAVDAVQVSAKTGQNVDALLEELVRRIPPPKGDPAAALQALIIDSWFDNYVGVVSLVRVMNGTLRVGEKMKVMSTGRSHQIDKLGRFTPKSVSLPLLAAGEVGFVIAGIREIDGAPVGGTPSPPKCVAVTTPLPGSSRCSHACLPACFPVNNGYLHYYSLPVISRNTPANTRGCTCLKPGRGVSLPRTSVVMVSPTGAPSISLMPAMTNPTSPAPATAGDTDLGVKRPSLSIW